LTTNSLNTGISFSGNKIFVATSNQLLQDKVAVTLSVCEFDFDINKKLVLKGNDPLITQVVSELSKYINPHTAIHLSVAIDPALFLTTVIPADHSSLSSEELESVIHDEFGRITGEKQSAYIYEWIPLAGSRVLILWVPSVVINFLQILATQLQKKLAIVDFEPLAIMNLMNERQISPSEGLFHLVVNSSDSGFTFMGYTDRDVLFYQHFIDYPQDDIPYFLLNALRENQLSVRSLDTLYWYGKFSQQVLSNLMGSLNTQPVNLFEKLKILYHRHQESPAFFLESALAAISVSYRTEN